MLSPDIERIFREMKPYLNMLKEYDETGVWPFGRVKRTFSISRVSDQKLKEATVKLGAKKSQILDRIIQKSTF